MVDSDKQNMSLEEEVLLLRQRVIALGLQNIRLQDRLELSAKTNKQLRAEVDRLDKKVKWLVNTEIQLDEYSEELVEELGAERVRRNKAIAALAQLCSAAKTVRAGIGSRGVNKLKLMIDQATKSL